MSKMKLFTHFEFVLSSENADHQMSTRKKKMNRENKITNKRLYEIYELNPSSIALY